MILLFYAYPESIKTGILRVSGIRCVIVLVSPVIIEGKSYPVATTIGKSDDILIYLERSSKTWFGIVALFVPLYRTI